MNAQPEENERSKAGTVLKAAEQGSGGSGILVSGNSRPLDDIDRNLRCPFLDSTFRQPTIILKVKSFIQFFVLVILSIASQSGAFAAEEKKAPEAKQEIEFGGGVKMELVLVNPGKFTMGSPVTEKGREAAESQHAVTISKAFYMGKYTVTQEQYEKVMGSNPSKFKGAKKPVENVSWDDAQEFCRKLSTTSAKTVRLPTEAEWEYACRAGSATAYCFGDDEAGLAEYAWHGTSGTTDPVGEKKPNAWGLYDMHRNVYEWCQDRYGDYPAGAATDPQGPVEGADRVMRGGCWVTSPGDCRSAHRIKVSPSIRGVDFLGMSFGFRVVVAPH